MRAIDEAAQIIRRTIQMGRRKEIYTVISPSEFPREIGDGHHLDYSDSDTRQLFQLLRSGAPRSFLRERADVHFVNDLAF